MVELVLVKSDGQGPGSGQDPDGGVGIKIYTKKVTSLIGDLKCIQASVMLFT